MTDPYKVLGVAPNATDEQVKEAYRTLAKKYHPDQYADSPLKELADEKMKEINEAYDTVVNQRKQGTSQQAQSKSYTGGYNYVNTDGNSGFRDVRQLIMAGRFADAEQILNGVPVQSRNAEWYFLKGSVLYRRGWLEEAREHFAEACRRDPGNAEYTAAMNQASNQRSGAYGGYSPNMNQNVNGCNSCDVCTGLMAADCCCECMGGDLISCC
ncbi:J domain-containing protein [Scatolibacter rhodanostii]|uniref:J domain-containing protein n=1 Tax=Scatolibacter rhodanostii TaxID=2014781 RepID=UPI000C078ADA|nr:DnaJ domain-containing protein [Scatolibacter rhodanostii]